MANCNRSVTVMGVDQSRRASPRRGPDRASVRRSGIGPSMTDALARVVGRVTAERGAEFQSRRLREIDNTVLPVPFAAIVRPKACEQPGLMAIIGTANRPAKQNHPRMIPPAADQLAGVPGERRAI